MPHPALHPAGSVESIAHALNRLTLRQNARKYAVARRPVVSALRAASRQSPVSAQPLPQENSRGRESNATSTCSDNIDYGVLVGNSNHSNDGDYATPFIPSYATMKCHNTNSHAQLSPTATLENHTLRNDAHYLCSGPLNYQSFTQQSHPTLSSSDQPSLFVGEPLVYSQVMTNYQSTNSYSSSPNIQSSKDSHHSSCLSVSTPPDNSASHANKTRKSEKSNSGTSASLDFLKRIQLHNKAISHYIAVQRQRQSPGVLSMNSPSPPPRRQPTPSSLSSHSHTVTSAPSFKFVVPHPPSTPKPNFIPRGHRGVLSTTPISM